MEQVLDLFRLNGRPVSCDPYGEGHINLTFLAVTDTGKRYILQRLSRAAFHDIPGLMGNVAAVTEFLAARSPDPRSSLHLIPTLDGRSFCRDSEGEFWRVYDFVEDSLCLQTPETPEDFYQSAVAFGQFQCRLRDFPAETLCETIPNFHNTPDRYRKFHLAVDADAAGRLSSVLPEIRFLLEREEKAGTLQRLREGGELPVRVTHNDTKLNNVMLDAVTRKALCVIDLDTVMPGLVAYDFGDSIRFGASTAPEDEKDLSRVEMSLDLYETYARGFIPA
ncbi:MAG: phosphotransferase enzyme family protein, partial [Eubacteriales bacterium]